MLFAVYDELLTKYGLKVKAGEKGQSNQSTKACKPRPSSPLVLDPNDPTGTVTYAGIPSDGPIPPRELWGNDPISIRQRAALTFFGIPTQPAMTKGQASDILDKVFAIPAKRQSWETAKLSNMATFKGTALYDLILQERDGQREEVNEESLDEALEIITYLALEAEIKAREEAFNITCPKCCFVMQDFSSKCPNCGHTCDDD
jgi:hypothetical protein